MEIAIIVAVVVVALVFDYTNGFHDAANAIATSVSTRALTPRVALAMAASSPVAPDRVGRRTGSATWAASDISYRFSGSFQHGECGAI